MAEIHERLYVNVPFSRAPRYFEEFIRAHQAGQLSLSSGIELRTPIPGQIEMKKTVQVTFREVADPGHLVDRTELEWHPVDGSPVPTFSGSIVISADENHSMCCMTLEGMYEPPLGKLGSIFDAIVGNKVARDTARRLLDSIAEDMERSHRLAFAAKAS
ncbi:MAG TPA: hypothetical protein VKT51_06750 [Candidatus Eremiobacteraceae bacterium]|nr:hypothetical protein [Candidatus Eremiobacteraceae bacterium]